MDATRTFFKHTRMERLLETDQLALNKLKTNDWFLGDIKVQEFFEERHRAIELWKKVRSYFQRTPNKELKEILEEEVLHRGSEKSRLKKMYNWTIHPYSFLKFVIYFFKLLSLIYNFFFIQVM